MKLELVFVAFFASVAFGFRVNTSNDSPDSTEMYEPRGVDKGFKLLYNLYRMFKSKGELRPAKPKYEIVPLNGIYPDDYYTSRIDKLVTLADLNKQDGNGMASDMMKESETKKEEEPQYWLFDKYSKKVDLVLLTKILLKLIIFKKIVKFIALVCLLFFIPAIKDDSAKEERNAGSLNVYGEKFDSKKIQSEKLISCRSNRLPIEGNSNIRNHGSRSFFD